MLQKKDIHIDYDNSILAVSNSLLKHFDVSTKYASQKILDNALRKQYQNIVLIITDGMGVNVLSKNLHKDSFLRQHVATHINSVYPPTTTAATTAYHSGLPPIASGWLGWMTYFPQYNKIIEIFRNKDFYTGEQLTTPKPPETILKYTSIYEKIIQKQPEIEYHRIFPAFEENGCHSFKEECEKIISYSQKNNKNKLLITYWTEPDHTMHEQGVSSQEVQNIIQDINDNVEKMCKQLKNTLIIMSADHGMLDTEMVLLNDYPKICTLFQRPPSLESRFVNFFIKKGKQKEFEKQFESCFKQDFILFTKQEFLKTGILGQGTPHKFINQTLGDFLAVAVGKKSLHYTTGEKTLKQFKGEHAGFTPEEISIPLILIECQ